MADMTAEKNAGQHSGNVSRTQTLPWKRKTEIDLIDLLFRLLEQIRFIILMAILGALLAASYTFVLVTPIYEATSKLYVLNSNDSALNLSDLQIGSYLASDYIEVFKTWEVHEMVISNLGLHYSYSELQSMLTIEKPNGYAHFVHYREIAQSA